MASDLSIKDNMVPKYCPLKKDVDYSEKHIYLAERPGMSL